MFKDGKAWVEEEGSGGWYILTTHCVPRASQHVYAWALRTIPAF